MTNAEADEHWEFKPFETILIARIKEIDQLIKVSTYSIRAMEGAARLTRVLMQSEAAIEQAQNIESLALAEASADFPLLHSAAAVLLWGALESAVRDFLVRWLCKYPAARQIDEVARIKVQIGDYERLEGEDRMRHLVGLLERDLAAALKPGAGRFDSLLKPFGIAPRIDAEVRRDLHELAAVRNVIVHRASSADARLLALCPWLSVKENEPVKVSSDCIERYLRAISLYAASLIEIAGALPIRKASAN